MMHKDVDIDRGGGGVIADVDVIVHITSYCSIRGDLTKQRIRRYDIYRYCNTLGQHEKKSSKQAIL